MISLGHLFGKLQQGLRLGRLLVGLRRLGGLRAGDVVLLVEQLLPYTYMLRLGARLLNCTASEFKIESTAAENHRIESIILLDVGFHCERR